jgi:hypothetical protein
VRSFCAVLGRSGKQKNATKGHKQLIINTGNPNNPKTKKLRTWKQVSSTVATKAVVYSQTINVIDRR